MWVSAVPGALCTGQSGRRPGCESEGAAPLSTAGASLGASQPAHSYLLEIGVPSRVVPVTQNRSGEKLGSLEP